MRVDHIISYRIFLVCSIEEWACEYCVSWLILGKECNVWIYAWSQPKCAIKIQTITCFACGSWILLHPLDINTGKIRKDEYLLKHPMLQWYYSITLGFIVFEIFIKCMYALISWAAPLKMLQTWHSKHGIAVNRDSKVLKNLRLLIPHNFLCSFLNLSRTMCCKTAQFQGTFFQVWTSIVTVAKACDRYANAGQLEGNSLEGNSGPIYLFCFHNILTAYQIAHTHAEPCWMLFSSLQTHTSISHKTLFFGLIVLHLRLLLHWISMLPSICKESWFVFPSELLHILPLKSVQPRVHPSFSTVF